MSCLIGIAGGTAGCKTTFSNWLANTLGSERTLIICSDDYYKAQDHLSMSDRVKTDYDVPSAIDESLMLQHLSELRSDRSIVKPRYDFVNHTRDNRTDIISPRDFIIVEGIFTLCNSQMRDLYSLKVFIDVPAELRFMRRLKRDVTERGRTPESVKQQWESTVHPGHMKFCEPSKAFADIVLSDDHAAWPQVPQRIGELAVVSKAAGESGR